MIPFIITEISDEEIEEYKERTKNWKWEMPIIEKPKHSERLLPKGVHKYTRRVGKKSSMDYKNTQLRTKTDE